MGGGEGGSTDTLWAIIYTHTYTCIKYFNDDPISIFCLQSEMFYDIFHTIPVCYTNNSNL